MSSPRLLAALFPLPAALVLLLAALPFCPGGRTEAAPATGAAPAARAGSATKLAAVPTAKVEWTPVYYKGRSYVPATQVAAYYDLNIPEVWNRAFTLKREKISTRDRFSVEMSVGEKRVRLNGWTFFFSFAVVKTQEIPMISVFDVRNVLDPILRPTARRDPAILRTVILDPSGGGRDPGIESAALSEKNLTLEVAKVLVPLLKNEGYKVVLTRDEDKLVLPSARVRTANEVLEESVFINLRAASAVGAVKGFECSTLPPAGTPATNESDSPDIDKRFFAGNISDRESLALATTVQNSVVSEAETVDLGVRRVRVDELRDLRMPAISCKLGYLSSKEEARKLATREYRDQLAVAIVHGVQRYADFLRRDLAERAEEDRLRPLRFGPVTVKEEVFGAGTIETTNPDRAQAAQNGGGKGGEKTPEDQKEKQTPAAPEEASPPPAATETNPENTDEGSGKTPEAPAAPAATEQKPRGADPSPESPKPPPAASAPVEKEAESGKPAPQDSPPVTEKKSDNPGNPVPASEKPPEEKPPAPAADGQVETKDAPAEQPADKAPDTAPPVPSEPEKTKPSDARAGEETPEKSRSAGKRKSSGKKASSNKSARQRSPEDEAFEKKAPAKRPPEKKPAEKPVPEKKPADKPVPEKPAAPVSLGDRVTLRLPIVASGLGKNIDRSQVELQIFLFESVNGAEIDLTTSNPPETRWLSILPDWKAGVPEWMQVSYFRPPFSATEEKQYGKRSYYGYVARLIYAGRLMDETSYPPNLNRCLYYFTPVFPRR